MTAHIRALARTCLPEIEVRLQRLPWKYRAGPPVSRSVLTSASGEIEVKVGLEEIEI